MTVHDTKRSSQFVKTPGVTPLIDAKLPKA